MRTVILAISIAIAPVPALAMCSCACVGGEAVARCDRPSEIAPICQKLCLPTVAAPSMTGPSVALPGAPTRRPDPVMIEEQRDELRSQGITPQDGQPLR